MKVQILVPTPNGLVMREAIEAIHKQTYMDVSLFIHGLPPIPINPDPYKNKSLNILRNRIVMRKMALATDAEWFLWVDSDTVIPPKTIEIFLNHGKPLSGGWYKKVIGEDWVAARKESSQTYRFFNKPEEGIIKVDMFGLGCAMMRRDVLEKVDFRGATEEYVFDQKGVKFYAGQCMAFCHDAEVAGFESFLIGDIICNHLPMPGMYNPK